MGVVVKGKAHGGKEYDRKNSEQFNVSIAGVKEQDTFKTVVLGIAWVTSTVRQADSILEQLLIFIEDNTDAEIINVLHELR